MVKITALIPAAGYSSRMGLYKPLLPLDDSLVIEKPILAFKKAGIDDISVIVGYKAHLLLPVLSRLGVKTIFNPDYDQGMYTSIQAGVAALQHDKIDAFFLLPADYACIKPETIHILWQTFVETRSDVVYPLFDCVRGHPPLISTKFRESILRSKPEGGLRELLLKEACNSIEVPVEDAGVLVDLDSESDYMKVLDKKHASFPSYQECIKILNQYQTEERVLDHVKEVARTAGIIAEHLNSRGLRIQLGLVMAGALLHDIAKGKENHAQKGHDILMELGYPETAKIIAEHMELKPQNQGIINETTIVYMADKMVKGSQVVPLEKRLQEQNSRYKDDPLIQQIAAKRMENALDIQSKIERILQLKIDEILKD